MPTAGLTNGAEIPGRIFAAAICDAVATMAGIGLERIGATPSPGGRFNWDGFSGAMILAGNKTAMLSISADKASAGELVSFMTGMEKAELSEDDLCDGMGELVNMVAGMARLKLADSDYRFNLSAPFALTGDAGIITKRSTVGYFAELAAGGVRLKMRLFYV